MVPGVVKITHESSELFGYFEGDHQKFTENVLWGLAFILHKKTLTGFMMDRSGQRQDR